MLQKRGSNKIENRKRQKEYELLQHKILREFDHKIRELFLIYVLKRNFLCFFWFLIWGLFTNFLTILKIFFYELDVFLWYVYGFNLINTIISVIQQNKCIKEILNISLIIKLCSNLVKRSEKYLMEFQRIYCLESIFTICIILTTAIVKYFNFTESLWDAFQLKHVGL